MKNPHDRYLEYLAQAKAAGRAEVLPDRFERRRHPRIRIPAGLLHAEESVARDMVDISLGGFAFFASRVYESGERVLVRLKGTVSTTAKVLDCAADAGGSPSADRPYRVRCQFTDEEEALLLLSMTLEIGGLLPGETKGEEEGTPDRS